MSITKKNLQDAAQKVSDVAETLKKSVDGGFHDGEVIEPPDALPSRPLSAAGDAAREAIAKGG